MGLDRWLGSSPDNGNPSLVLKSRRNPAAIAEVSRAKKSIVKTFSRAYSSASPDEQAALRVWMRNIIRPQEEPRVDVAKAKRFEKDSVEARNRRILEFPVSISHREVAKALQAEGWFSLKTTVYYIEYRVRRLREKGHPENAQAEEQNRRTLQQSPS